MKIEGTLTTRSPLTIASPNAGDIRVNLSGRYSKQGFPATEVVRLGIPSQGEEHPAGRVPVISANSLRGQLRRAGTRLIELALKARGEKITLGTFHSLHCGTPYGHPDQDAPSTTEIQQALTVPPLAVFGGGPRMIESGLRVDTGFPVTTATISRGLVNDRHLDKAMPPEDKLTTFLFLRRADDAATFVAHDLAEHVVGNYVEAVDAWQTLIGKSLEATEGEEVDAKAGVFRGLAALNAMEIVLPGTTFSFGLDLHSDNPRSQGFLLLALAEFANTQALGGHKRLGFGRFALDVVCTLDGKEHPALTCTGGVYAVNTSVKPLEQAVTAAKAWLDSVTAADLESLLRPSETSLDNVKKKLKGKPEAEAALATVFGAA